MSNKYDYETAGYDEFLNRGVEPPKEILEDESSTQIKQVTGSSIASGISRSSDGKTQINWNSGESAFSDGARKRVLVGNLNNTGIYGIRIVDKQGNVRFESSDNLEQISMYDSNFNELVKLINTGLYIYDTSANELVKLDGSGLTVNTGKITIKDEDETTVIDSKGLVSTANFPYSSSTLTPGQSVTAVEATPVDVTSATYDITVSRTTTILFLWTVRGYIATQNGANFDGRGIIGLKIGSGSIAGADTMVIGGAGGAAADAPEHTIISSYTAHQVKQLSSGTTTCKLVAWIDQGGTGNAKLYISSVVFSYIQLGK